MYKLISIGLFAHALFAVQGLSASSLKKPKPVVVAVVDTGIDLQHPQLKPYLWVNSGEQGRDSFGRNKASNGLDDDANGYVDDVHGWNFAGHNHQIEDRHGHGSHISGLISKGLPARKVKLMTLKYYDPGATGAKNLASFVESLSYALKMGAQIINISGGGSAFSKDEFALLSEARQRDVTICAASGNSGEDVADRAFYPATYKLENIISAASVDSFSQLLPSTNYGEQIDFAAPGLDQLSTLPRSRSGVMTGSSQATANLCNLVASLLLQDPRISTAEISQRLEQTGVWHKSLFLKTRTGTIPNLQRLQQMSGPQRDAFGRRLPSSFPSTMVYQGP